MSATPLFVHTADSPLGALRLYANEAALLAIYMTDHAGAPSPDARDGAAHRVLREAARQLGEYFAGTRTGFDLPLDPRGTDFQRRVWDSLRAIPFGETSSYSGLAAAIGRPKAVRAVGAANARNPLSIVVPCHRVIGADGSLTGYAGGTDRKAWLLRHERIAQGAAVRR